MTPICPPRKISRRKALSNLASAVTASMGVGAATGCGRPHTADSAGVTTIDFWNGFTGPDGKTMERMIRRFERDNPDVRVHMQIIAWAQYYDKLTLGIAFHQAPDLFVCAANRLPEFAQYGVFKALDSPPIGIQSSDFLPNAWRAAQYDGKLYGIPLDCHAVGLYYNRRLFQDAGIVDSEGAAKPPASCEEFLESAHKLTKRTGGEQQWGFSFTWQHHNWYTFLFQNGGNALTPDLKQAALNQPEGILATTQMRSLISQERVAPNPEGIDAWRGFRLGRVAMVLEGVYMLADLQQSEGLDYAGAPVPDFGPVRATWAGSHILCLPSQAARGGSGKREQTAMRLLGYLSDHSLDWAEGGQIPARKSLLDSDRFRAMTVQSQFARQLGYVHYEPPTTRATEIGPFMDDAIESSLLGLQAPKEALDEAAGRINRVLART